ncbi:MAG: CBS domain-containing protein [Phycisphaerales bacterium]|nr:CBS domain-containing protein [Phycisphaerales bacterium]
MATAEQLVSVKGESVAWLPPSATVLDAARLMNDRHIGSVVVMDDGHLVGIFTERDVLRRIVAAQRDPGTTRLSEVMTAPVAVAAPYTLLDELRAVVRERRIRHVPVVDGEHVLGMISIGDLNRIEQQVQQQTIMYLEQFISTT